MIRKFNIDKFKLPLLLICILLLPMLVGEYISTDIKSFSYAISLSMKHILVFILPFIIFSFLSYSLISLGSGAVVFIVLLMCMVSLSNFIAIMTGYTMGATFVPFFNIAMPAPILDEHALKPSFNIILPKIIGNEPAIIAGVLIGLFFAFKPNTYALAIIQKLNQLAASFLKDIFLPILPLFILGFVFKLEHDRMLATVLTVYGPVLLLVVSTQLFYTGFYYLLAVNFSPTKCMSSIRNMLPATITGFTTISSAATMPVTIMCTEKNLNSASMTRTIIPATANIHTVGSALGLTILCMATMQAFYGDVPSFIDFIEFAIFYTIAKYAVAGIPGGVVIVVTPLLESYLGFSPEMVGLITAVYLLFDPFGTATNVTCNGAFAILFGRIYRFFGKELEAEQKARIKA